MQRTQPRQRKFFILIFFAMMGLGLIVCEFTIRYLGVQDEDGNFRLTLLNTKLDLRPFHLPINFVKEEIAKSHVQQTYLRYDPTLGWDLRPRSISQNGLYSANNEGIRRNSIDESTKSGNKALQIILLGDSYTHGDEVAFDHTWGHYLQTKLARLGIQADVINLGVPAYGMDQAYLRWKTLGVKFSPDIVIFGFQPENVKRNLNIFRKLYHKSAEIPFSKPRFMLAGNALQTINSPTVRPEQIEDTFRKFDRWENQKYEFYYQSQEYEDHIWLGSKFIAAIIAGIDHWKDKSSEYEFYAVDQYPSRLALAIVNELRADVEQRGSTFLVATLIPKWDFKYVKESRAFPYQDLLDTVKRQYETVETHQRILNHAKDGNAEEVFLDSHYSGVGNEIIADVISEAIAAHQLSTHH